MTILSIGDKQENPNFSAGVLIALAGIFSVKPVGYHPHKPIS